MHMTQCSTPEFAKKIEITERVVSIYDSVAICTCVCLIDHLQVCDS